MFKCSFGVQFSRKCKQQTTKNLKLVAPKNDNVIFIFLNIIEDVNEKKMSKQMNIKFNILNQSKNWNAT